VEKSKRAVLKIMSPVIKWLPVSPRAKCFFVTKPYLRVFLSIWQLTQQPTALEVDFESLLSDGTE